MLLHRGEMVYSAIHRQDLSDQVGVYGVINAVTQGRDGVQCDTSTREA